MLNGRPAGVPGFDCYHGDGKVDFAAAKEFGMRFAFIKASEGVGIVDPMYPANRTAAKGAGILLGAYHFFDPKADPLHQARFFVQSAAPKSGELIPALDVEVASPSIGHDALACAYEIKWLCGHFPILYSGQAFYLDHLHPVFPETTTLWIARYGAEPTVACTFWQWTDFAPEPGVSRPFDGDMFRGSEADLAHYLIA